MATIEDVLQRKGMRIHTVSPSETVFAAIERMSEHNVGALVATDEAGRLVGIVTERDYLRKVALRGRTSQTTRVEEIMTHEVVAVSPSADVDQCLALMTERRIRHLPVVVDRGKLVGIVSVGDLVKQELVMQRFEIEQLTAYIQGTPPLS
jgi:CBS domain-containing protein